MRLSYVFIVLFLSSSIITAQDVLNERVQNTMQQLIKKRTNSSVKKANNDHYINKAYIKGAIYYDSKKTPEDYYLRYNAFKDLIEISQAGGGSDFVLEDENISCTIGASKYIYSKLSKGDDIDEGYLKLIYNGENSALYEREIILYKEGKKARTSLTPDIPAKYVKFKSYYVIEKGNDIAKEIPTKRKKFIASFKKEHQKKIKLFIKKNKIDLEENSDAIKVYKYSKTL